jgi:oxygen-independent coproporphyrinogen III oxidase
MQIKLRPDGGRNTRSAGAPMEFDPALVRRYDRAGPRYTSYPTADRFIEAFDEAAYRISAERRNIGGVERPLALYVHLPFCRDVCYYCACNKIVTRNTGKAAGYLEFLGREIDLQARLFGDDPRVTRMHWGGGTPTYYDSATLAALLDRLADRFEFAARMESSIEVDPRTVDVATIGTLRQMGFNRVSFGVQDFDAKVQIAVHRIQGEEHTLEVIEAAHRAGFDSVNVDLIYGLPGQTPESLDHTLAKVIGARPHRVALYNYAHLPSVFKPQRRILEADLPAPDIKLKLLGLAIERFTAAGYCYIGMDHFALPQDELAAAQRQGRLRRDFQGYSTRAEADLVALGVSAISAIGPTYSQNHRDLEAYYESIDHGGLPIMRGVELTADDLVRRAVIHGLMCNLILSKDAIEIAHLVDFDRYFETEIGELREFEKEGMLTLGDEWISVSPRGHYMLRSICMVFDKYLRAGQPRGRYSRAI